MSHPTGGEPARAATQQRTQASLLTDTVLDDIIAGRLLPGAKLKLKELAERYDTGVNPLREALSRPAAPSSDFDLNPGTAPQGVTLRPAGVLAARAGNAAASTPVSRWLG